MGDRPDVLRIGSLCCGCGACAAACPVTSLIMKPDELGFLHPLFADRCIGCAKCAKVCPVLNPMIKDEIKSAKWAKANDSGLRFRSSSGAIFGLLAQEILDDGGVVYGAAFNEGCKSVKHVRINQNNDLDVVMRAKYVQSALGTDVFYGAKNDLFSGRRVLFSGTSCQCAAMKNYLQLEKAPLNKLLLVDVICHGVPSPRLWTEWLEAVSRTTEATIDGVNFRNKSTGWSTYSVTYYAETEKILSRGFAGDWYMRAFLKNASLRESCFNCPSKRSCGSDITLGDFWGVHKTHPEVEDNLGVSAVICNSLKGKSATEGLRGFLEEGDASFEEIIAGNPALTHSVKSHPNRDEFLFDVASGMSIDELKTKWEFKASFYQRLHRKISDIKKKLLI